MPGHDEEIARRPADELQRVARNQRWIVAVVLAQLALWAGCLFLGLTRRGGSLDLEFPLFLTVALGCVGGIYAFLIYWTVRDPFWAVVMGLASIPPVVGLLTLTVVNGTATRTLNASGVAVGLFGAEPADIDTAFAWLDEDGDDTW